MTRLLALTALAVAASGCATIARGPTDTVRVEADRDSAYVFVDGVPAAVAPANLEMKRSSGHRVEVVRPGYRVARADVARRANAGAVAGALAGAVAGSGLLGLTTDVATGAMYDLAPDVVRVTLVPDSAGAEAGAVRAMVREAREAEPGGFARASPDWRPPGPRFTAQTAVGSFVGQSPDGDGSTGGLGVTLALGARTRYLSVRASGTASSGFLFSNSERWEVAALVGVVGEAARGRLRLGLSAGPGLSGGRGNSACFLFCDPGPRERERLPTRLGLSVLGEVYAFVTPQIGIGFQVPVNVRPGDVVGGAMVGWKFEGL